LKHTINKLTGWIFASFLAVALLAPAQAETFQYVYDETGRLIKAIDSTGTVIEYVYDDVGNILEIKRSSVSGLAIFGFASGKGPVGTNVLIQGQGFSNVLSDNIVDFSGTNALVSSGTANTLDVTVPAGATTGPISVTVDSTTAVSGNDFQVLVFPTISSLSQRFVLAESAITDLQVTGANLGGSAFAFKPEFVPPALTIENLLIQPDGASASLDVTVASAQKGSFVLVSTNAEGSSNLTPTVANTLTVLIAIEDEDGDGVSNAEELGLGTNPLNPDSDGDGFLDGEEIEFGSDPLDENDEPIDFGAQFSEASGGVVSVFNQTDPSAVLVSEASGAVVSVFNQTDPSAVMVNEASGAVVSVFNQTDPSAVLISEASGAVVSVLNASDPSGPPIGDAVGRGVSVENLASP
jgi:YD repeat-containing protein